MYSLPVANQAADGEAFLAVIILMLGQSVSFQSVWLVLGSVGLPFGLPDSWLREILPGRPPLDNVSNTRKGVTGKPWKPHL